MSEVQSRPYGSRGRGSFRGGRGGYRGTRTGTKGHVKSDDQENLPPASLEDEGEVGELKKTFGNKVSSLREVCGGWSDEDLVYALQETNGDVDLAFDRISSGSISQWGEVKKKQSKAKDASTSAIDSSAGGRGGRGRGTFETRSRGRGTERSRGGRGARAASQTNGTRNSEKVTAATGDGWADTPATIPENTTAWENAGNPDQSASGWEAGPDTATTSTGDWVDLANNTEAPPIKEEPKSEPPLPTVKLSTWSKLFAAPPPAPKKTPAPVVVAQPEEIPSAPAMEQNLPGESLPPYIEPEILEDNQSHLPEAPRPETPIDLTPSKDELTETNLELLPDVSNPPATATAASTIASTQDPLSSLPTIAPAVRPGMSGYAASALKATSGAGRSASFTRRVMEQQEAVVMPGNHAVDRAAVQFGSMGLNGSSDDVDVDEDREEPETRTQLPDDSPAAPRASLPPTHHEIEATAPSQPMPEVPQSQRQAPGLPPVQHQMSLSTSSPPAPTYSDQYRYGQTGPKGYDPFGQQQPQQAQSQLSQPQSLEPFANQVPAQSQQQAATGQNDYSSYYGNNARDPYQQYYSQYGQAQDTQQRSGSASFGTSAQDAQSQYATSRPQHAYAQQDAQNSGHNTPNPTMPGHQTQHSQHMPQNQAGYGGYQYGHPSTYGQQYPQYGAGYGVNHRYGANRPLFDDVRRQAGQDNDYYMSQPNQYAYGQNQQQYGGSYNKSGMYGQPQQQYSYEQSSSPANTGAYNQSTMGGREAAYGRTGSAQPSESQQTASNTAFGGMPDPFGRSHSGFGQQTGADDAAKAYEAAKASGPSPAIGQSNRPGSAVNNMPGQQTGQSGSFPPPQSQQSQQTFGGYPQYGGGYGAGHQAQSNHPQSAGYAGYGSNAVGFGATYGGQYGSGRGWNGNYGASH